MIHEKRLHLKVRNGFLPGGWDCPCCGPAPGKDRKTYVRISKKRERRMFSDLIQLELDEIKGANNLDL